MFASICTRRPARFSVSALLLAVSLAILAAAPAAAILPGSVYTETNAAVNNEVVAFTRAATGTISESLLPTARFSTSGTGQGFGGLPILNTQGAVDLSDSQHLLFAVNAGTDSLSSFLVQPGGGLVRADIAFTGVDPSSLDSHGDIVYVLQRGPATIQAFRAAANGQLTPIAGSTRSLSPGAGSEPAQVAYDRTGRFLTVTHRVVVAPAVTEKIDTFIIDPATGLAGSAIASDAEGPVGVHTGQTSFGFAYDGNNHLIVSDSGAASGVTSYTLNPVTGRLAFNDFELTSPGGAPCWVVITPDSKFAFVSNPVAGTISRLSIDPATGALTQLGTTVVAGGIAGAAPVDMALSSDGAYLTVLLPPIFAATPSTETYQVGVAGGLTLLAPGGATATPLPAGSSGLVASATDATAPDTAITGGPAAGARTNDTTPTFAFTAVPTTEANPTFTCAVDGGAAAACTTPFTTAVLAEGAHTLSVAATDFGGNTDATPATRAFTIDTVAPNTTITAGPANGGPTGDNTPTFGFTSTEAGSSFRCRVDSRPVVACSSPFTTVVLASGSHTFSVAATDSAGNADATAATRTFRVKRAQPGCALSGTQTVGTSAGNTLTGGSGVDIIFGLGGADTLSGRGNRDCLYGGTGADRLNGGRGNDRMLGEAGKDRITDGRGKDVFSGGSQNDRIDSRDDTRSGRRVADTVRCGSGRDTALVDRIDHVSRDCERVFRS